MGHCDNVYLTEVGDTQVVVFKHGESLVAPFCSTADLSVRVKRDKLSGVCGFFKQRKKTVPSLRW